MYAILLDPNDFLSNDKINQVILVRDKLKEQFIQISYNLYGGSESVKLIVSIQKIFKENNIDPDIFDNITLLRIDDFQDLKQAF